jgi:hypothetical protein
MFGIQQCLERAVALVFRNLVSEGNESDTTGSQFTECGRLDPSRRQ